MSGTARAKLVNRSTLAERGRELGVGDHLILSRGEETHGGRERLSALADAYEAVVGAIFLDGGFEMAKDFILREFDGDLYALDSTGLAWPFEGEDVLISGYLNPDSGLLHICAIEEMEDLRAEAV